MISATDRTHRLLLAGSFVFAVFAASVAWREASAATTWTLAGALLLLAAMVGWGLRRAAAERVALQAEVDRLAARLEQFTNAQARFVDSIAHEIKTPLTIVLNHAELLLRCSDDPAAVRSHGKSLADYALHLSDLFEGFLRLDGPSAAADTSHHAPVHVHDLVIEAVRRSQSIARGRGVSVVLTIAELGSEAAALEVLGNEALLRAMIESLVRHAVRGSPRGSRVELQVQIRGESILLRLRDHGTVIAPADLESVFDWFFQASGATQPSPGNGGGLAIGKRIVEHHRGTIAVQNHPEGGCEFVVTLPRWRGEALPSSGWRAAVSPPASTPSSAPPIARPA